MAQNLLEKTLQDEVENENGEESDEQNDGEVKVVFDQMSEEYKLFEVVTSSHPKQVLRYISPNLKLAVEPLWTSDKRKLSQVPKCQHCGSKRNLEIQITPQLFDFMTPLHFVDWETICIYTCSNVDKCLPRFAKNEYIVDEYAYVQFSTDFDRVQYGTPEQIAQSRSQASETQVYVQSEEEKKSEEEKARKKAEKNKKARDKKKQKAKEAKESHEQIQQQISQET